VFRETVRRCGTGGDDVRGVGGEPAIENDVCARRARLREETAIERAVFRPASNEVAVRLVAFDDATASAMVVERCPVDGTKVEVPLDADAIEEVGNELRFRRRFDDLQVADEARSDVALRLVHLASAAGCREMSAGGA